MVAYGFDEHLSACLEALSGQLPVTVVDNSQEPRVLELTRRLGGTYVDPGGNLGFAKGVNRGIARLRPDADVLLVNPDAVLTPEALEGIRVRLERDTAAVAPGLVGVDGQPQRVRWPFPSPKRALRQAVLGGDGGPAAEGFLVGAVLLLNRQALDDVGPFDESFFLYAEETDWQRRAVDRGWRLGVAEDVTVLHVGGATSSDARRRTALFHAGTETYLRKWHGARGWQVYRGAAVVSALIRAALRSRDRRESLHRAWLYARGPRRVAGVD